MVAGPPKEVKTWTIQVYGSGNPECDAIYEAISEKANDAEVYVSSQGYRISREVISRKGGLKYGWVLGKDRIGYYGVKEPLSADTEVCRVPPNKGWRCFSGIEPVPDIKVRETVKAELALTGNCALAKKQTKEAISSLMKALTQPRVTENMHEMGKVLC